MRASAVPLDALRRSWRAIATAALLVVLASGARAEGANDPGEGLVLQNGQMSQELRSRAGRLGTSTGGPDTLWVGYTPSAVSASNWWGVHAGFGKDGYNRPTNGVPHKGVWNWETPVHGDSLQGWWPVLNLYASTGGQTRTDRNRPWWALDFGNMANYRINQANGRTFGVIGVWHRDGGSLVSAPAGLPTPDWTPAQGSHAAWMGLRAHGDVAYSDARTGNPFNEDVLMFTGFGAVSASGNDQGFPGYGSQMDQMLYRDIDFTGNTTASLTLRFKFRAVLSTGFITTTATRTGWYDSDPLGVANGFTNPQPNNFISSSDAGDALAPRDSFMVYVGQGIEGQNWLPAASNFGQNLPAQSVYDRQRRWFGEVLRWDRDPNSNPANPQPRYYRELLSVTGVWPAGADSFTYGYVDTTYVIPNASIAPLLVNNRLRVVFRVKTNRSYDDQGTAYSSNERGAAVVDRASYQLGAGPEVVFGDFESAGDIDNDLSVSATAAWKSTGKPPGIFHHTHLFSDLLYEDLCGQKGDISRQCNMSGIVISMGDHDAGEASTGFVSGAAQFERNDGIMSPAIQLCGPFDQPGGKNRHGFTALGTGAGDAEATRDYYVYYAIYTGFMDPFVKGNLWRYAVMSYPGNSKDPDGGGGLSPYPAWGQMRFPGYIVFNPDPQCLTVFDPVVQQSLIRTSNANGIPDSIKIFVGKTVQCFRFGVSNCPSTDGGYWDNVTLAVVDGTPAPLSVEIWNWINDTFPASEAPGFPATAAFDTAGALVKTGFNIAQSPTQPNNLRFDVPGDSIVITTAPATSRVDMVFRILPGPGNYIAQPGNVIGRPDLPGATLKRRPDQIAAVTPGDGSFWDAYRQAPGDFASPNAAALHSAALGGWDPNVWNSARCDTAELNLFPRMLPPCPAASGNQVLTTCLPGPVPSALWMSTYHELDPHYTTLGVVKNRCFYRTLNGSSTDIVCDGTVPTYVSSRPEFAGLSGTTLESTKIIPDGLLTPGAHVEYFFRSQLDETPGAALGVLPDTNVVIQDTERSTDGHRWQQFGVLPNAWKKTAHFHPVVRQFGTGPACMLVVDNEDRRGNERVWVGIADTIGATPQRYWGAHNGWHAVGGGDVDDPADNRRGADNQPGFVSEHIGQPGSGGVWDMYQVKASESLTTSAGSLGSRMANRTGGAGQQLVIAKSSRQGPTPEMLDAHYRMMLYLTGDLDNGILGPYSNRSQNDAGILIEWLDLASSTELNRAFWAIGDGFVQSNMFGAEQITTDLMLDYLATDIVHWNYIQHSGNSDVLALHRLFPEWQNKGQQQIQLFGLRNLCLWTNDVITPGGIGLPALATVTSEYDRKSSPGGAYRAPAGVFKDWDPTSPYKTLVEGWDLEHLTHPDDVRTLDRSGYFYKIMVNVWSSLCGFGGIPVLDVPGTDEGIADFVRLLNNPVARGHASVRFGLARADRVEIKIFDVSGRLIRTLADRRFPAGEHELTWDGANDAGRSVARGVYFTQVRYRDGGFVAHRKVTVLR
jgi:hypothetical protein